MELYSKEEGGLLEEVVGVKEMEYYSSNTQDFITNSNTNIPAAWNIPQDFSNTTTTSSSSSLTTFFHDYYYDYDYDFFAAMDHHQPFFSSSHLSSYTSLNSSSAAPLPQHYYYYNHQNAPVSDPCKVEALPAFESHQRKNKAKKMDGQPSKNLMAERRRRKRLNDRLSMLRSVVPKITKMDRTSILGDAIDYMKELLHNINKLQQEMNLGEESHEYLGLFKNIAKPEEILIRNSPKFEVERRNSWETRIEISCCGNGNGNGNGNGGLLVSTVTTLEALGIDIKHCVISCFNDFAMQASCSHSQDLKQRAVLDCEDIKQALFRNAGYEGRCL